jgi:hypothetical protein
MDLNQLTFGVEIECYSAGPQVLVDAIRAAGVAVRNAGYTHAVTAEWKIVTDGSLSSRQLGQGLEVVSPILKGAEGRAELAKVMNALVAAGAVVDKSCGLHVHVGIAGASVGAVRNLAKLWAKYEAQFDSLVPATRRGSANVFCKSNFAAGGFGPSDSDEAVKNLADRLNSAGSISAIAKVMNGAVPAVHMARSSARYYKVNFQCFPVYGTVEFRMHSGTIDAEKATSWVELLTGFVARSFSLGSVKVAKAGSFDDLMRKAAPPVRRYYTARRAALAGATN